MNPDRTRIKKNFFAKVLIASGIFLSFFKCDVLLSAEKDESLLLDIKMKNGGGDILLDSSGYHNHAKIKDGKWILDEKRALWSLSFDGKSSYCAFNTGVEGESVEVWFKPGGKQNGERACIIQAAGRLWSGRESRFRYGIFVGADQSIKAMVGGNHSARDLPIFKTLQGKDKVLPEKWNHCVLLIEKGEISLYLNGVLVDKTSHSYMLISPNYITIGALYDDLVDRRTGNLELSFRDFFLGEIGEVRVYDRILSQNEILENSKTRVDL
jgi:hypothetical protein